MQRMLIWDPPLIRSAGLLFGCFWSDLAFLARSLTSRNPCMTSCGRLTAGHSSCHVPGLRSVGETLLCRARPHGITAFPSNCGLHHCLLRRLRKNSKLIYSAASASEDRFNWRYINTRIHSFIQDGGRRHLDNLEWPYIRNGSRSTYIARIAR